MGEQPFYGQIADIPYVIYAFSRTIDNLSVEVQTGDDLPEFRLVPAQVASERGEFPCQNFFGDKLFDEGRLFVIRQSWDPENDSSKKG
jgi:hypothetical protein